MRRIIPIFIFLSFTLTSCSGMTVFSNYREVEELDLVRTICADRSDEGVNVLICASPTGENASLRMYSQSAESFSIALNDLRSTPTGRSADLSHTENLLISEAAARDGIAVYLDYIVRYGELRLGTNLFIVRGESCHDFMTGISGEEVSPASVLAGAVRSLPVDGYGYVFTCKDTVTSLAENGCALVMAVKAAEDDKLFDGRGERKLEPAGFAVIRDGKLNDFLTDEETLGALLVLSKLDGRDVTLTVGDSELDVRINSVDTQIEPVFDGDTLTGIDITLECGANLVNMDGSEQIESADVRSEAETELKAFLEDAVNAVVSRSKRTRTDFLGLGGIVNRAAPFKYEKTGDFESVLGTLEFNVKAKSTIKRTYDVTDTVHENGEEESGNVWRKLAKFLSGS